jgi:hypothetical protein
MKEEMTMNEQQIQKFFYLRTDAELIQAATTFVNPKITLDIEEAVAFLRHYLPGVTLPVFGFGG